jgi:two-component system nitrogen regulation response regulator GlnG
MASSRTVLIEDLPPELRQTDTDAEQGSWESGLELWANQQLEKNPGLTLLDAAQPKFERIMINAALRKTGGRKKDAAELLGWGRNTLTRKMQELEL